MAKEKNSEEDILKSVIQQVEHEFGKGSLMRLGDRPSTDNGAISSGSILLDEALGIGGYPRGRIIEIYGPESSGKTTLALSAVAECQKKGEKVAFIDAENSIDPEYAKNLGVNIDDLILSQPDSGEEALEIVEMLAKSGVFGLDSVGLQARLMSKALRKITAILNKNACTVIFINQLR